MTPLVFNGVTYSPEEQQAARLTARKRWIKRNREAIKRLESGESHSSDPQHHIRYLTVLNERIMAGEMDDTFTMREFAFRILTHKPGSRRGKRVDRP